MTSRRLKTPGLNWSSIGSFYAEVTQAGRRLVLQTAPIPPTGKWTVIALESGIVDTVDAVFDDHAHKNLGTFRTPFEAIAAAELYAASWVRLRQRVAPTLGGPPDALLKPCTCKPVSRSSARAKRVSRAKRV
ncbi:MAG: hypothetical protein ACYDH4_09935 [Candidatus Cryosericum sp.]